MFLKISQYSQETHVLEPLFNNVVCLKTCNFIKKEAPTFLVDVTKFLRTAFFIEHFWWLLLNNYVGPHSHRYMFLISINCLLSIGWVQIETRALNIGNHCEQFLPGGKEFLKNDKIKQGQKSNLAANHNPVFKNPENILVFQ